MKKLMLIVSLLSMVSVASADQHCYTSPDGTTTCYNSSDWGR